MESQALKSTEQYLDIQRVQSWLAENAPEADEQTWMRGHETASILHSLDMAEESVEVGFLNAFLPFDDKQDEKLRELLGDSHVDLLQGVDKLRQLSSFSKSQSNQGGDSLNEEKLRKMLITMVDDVRVVLIKLADQLCQLRLAKRLDQEEQVALAELTLDIYAPLANRLGIWQLKWEMEDLAMRFLEPETYQNLAKKLLDKRHTREDYITQYIDALQNRLKEAGISAKVYGRPKHIYSIWRKMQSKGLTFENLWDIRAVRILVEDISDCYAALGVVHTNWRHLPGEFDDYIATPKENGYRSIHSVVIGPEEKSVEVQIRTEAMHDENELGIAAHWRYKESADQDQGIDNKVLWLRQLLEWRDELADEGELFEQFQSTIEEKRVYVFTPKGTVIDLPLGSTPIDFAYSIHSEVGSRTRGARVNGKMVNLSYVLKTGDQVQIQTAKNATPSRDWLRADLGYVKTQRARSRIQYWFKQIDHDQYVHDGRGMLEKELHRLGLSDLSYEKIAEKTHFHKTEDLLAALGSNDFKLSKALAPFKKTAEPAVIEPVKTKPKSPTKKDEFKVDGVGNLLTQMAKCCAPVPGDKIVGFITLGRGVTIHRRNCNNMKNLNQEQINRLIDVEWSGAGQSSYGVNLDVSAYHRSGLLHDITQSLKDNKVDVLMLNMDTDEEHIAHIQLRIEISGLQTLSKITNQLMSIPNVLSATRTQM